MSPNDLFKIIILMIVIDFIVDTLLNYLNSRRYTTQLPEELSDVYPSEEYAKSIAYKQINYKFNNVSSVFSVVVTLAFIFGGGFEWLDQWARSYSDNEVIISLLFFGAIAFGNDILSLPFSYYQVFVIEEQFGFNKMTPKTFFLDKLKGWAMMIVVGGAIIATIVWFYQWAGTNFWWYTWILITLFSLVMNMFYARLIVPLFNKQAPLKTGTLRDQIERYAAKVGFNLSNIFVIDGSKRSTKANAYFSGMGSEKRITLYDTLIDDLDEKEIVAVLAHEVGHYKKNHIIVNLIVSTLLTGLTLWILSLFIDNPILSEALGVSQHSFHIALIVFGILYSPISEITGLLMNYMSRKFEYQADDFAKNTYEAEPLITSLKKLSKNSLSNLSPHPAYVFVHYSHPTLLERIRNLRNP